MALRRAAFHDVTLANGPVGFASRWGLRGDPTRAASTSPAPTAFSARSTPIDMTQVVDVAPR